MNLTFFKISECISTGLLLHSIELKKTNKNNDYDNLYDLIIELNKLIDKSFSVKNTDYYNLLF